MSDDLSPGDTVVCVNAAPHGGGHPSRLTRGMFYQVTAAGHNFGGWQGHWVQVRGSRAYWNANRFTTLAEVELDAPPTQRVSLPVSEPA